MLKATLFATLGLFASAVSAAPGSIETRWSWSSEELDLPEPTEDSQAVNIGVFLTLTESNSRPALPREEAAEQIRKLVMDTNAILAQCDMHVTPETAQVLELPEHLYEVKGNHRGATTERFEASDNPNPIAYTLDMRLTDDTRKLFGYGKQHVSDNAISVFLVHGIEHYAGEEEVPAQGLSYPPVLYHHEDDFPLRNSVMVRLVLLSTDIYPNASPQVLGHELGHMLLNQVGHPENEDNFMDVGTSISEAQCQRMRANQQRLFGETAVVDPGPPEAAMEQTP